MYTGMEIISHIKEMNEFSNLEDSTRAIKKLEGATEKMFAEMRTETEVFFSGAEMAAEKRGELAAWLEENGFDLEHINSLNTNEYLYKFKVKNNS